MSDDCTCLLLWYAKTPRPECPVHGYATYHYVILDGEVALDEGGHWSPFAKDGKLRDDLFHSIRVNGEWVTNPNPNEGFWLVGAVTEDGGIEREPSIITINFTGVETLKSRPFWRFSLSIAPGLSVSNDR